MTRFLDDARQAAQHMREVFPETPLLRNAHLSERFGAEIWLKREDLSPVRSYKLRGAFNAMRKQREAKLFVCASAGNHAQGVAFMCRHFDTRGVIFMPVTTPQQKIQKTRMFGGDAIEIRMVGDYFDDTLHAAQSFCSEAGGHFLSPFDDDDVIAGQASVAVEIEEQMGGLPDHVVVPVGGGGLSAGTISYFGTGCQYTFVEPSGGACLQAALAAPGVPQGVTRVLHAAALDHEGEVRFHTRPQGQDGMSSIYPEALRADPGLYRDALDAGIGLASPSTLLAILRVVENLWRTDRQNRNAQKIAERAGALYDKFVGFAEDVDKIGTHLDRAQASYRDARGKLIEGRGNLARQAEMLKDLGAKTAKSLPAGLEPDALDDHDDTPANDD